MSDNIIQLNEAAIKGKLKDLVKSSVEETLNALLDHEADELVNAERYERSGDRKGYRSGHYDRNFTTTSGDITLHVPKLKGVKFETAIIERYRRRETSIEEALIEMYLAGVSVSGNSGEGKSTLIKCLAGILIPSKGEILINDKSINDIENYHEWISFIMQDSMLFNLSIWENLTLGRENITKENVDAVCRSVRIYEEIVGMQNGYETIIEGDGRNLSGGQRQKILIARALLCKPGLLIMDESNSALDVESETMVNKKLLGMNELTLLFISHRNSTQSFFPVCYELKSGVIMQVSGPNQ